MEIDNHSLKFSYGSLPFGQGDGLRGRVVRGIVLLEINFLSPLSFKSYSLRNVYLVSNSLRNSQLFIKFTLERNFLTVFGLYFVSYRLVLVFLFRILLISLGDSFGSLVVYVLFISILGYFPFLFGLLRDYLLLTCQ